MYHLVLFFNCVIMIKTTITWVKTQYFLQATHKLVAFFTFFKKVIF